MAGLVYYNDIPVGAVCSRIEKGRGPEEASVYIMTMGVLAVRISFFRFSHSYLPPFALRSVCVSVSICYTSKVHEELCVSLARWKDAMSSDDDPPNERASSNRLSSILYPIISMISMISNYILETNPIK